MKRGFWHVRQWQGAGCEGGRTLGIYVRLTPRRKATRLLLAPLGLEVRRSQGGGWEKSLELGPSPCPALHGGAKKKVLALTLSFRKVDQMDWLGSW